MFFVSGATILASPPVATTNGFDFTSTLMRSQIPSTRPAYPYMIPACMLLTVSLATMDLGLLSSTRGSLAARSKRASLEIMMPGAMHPPMYSPRAET